MTGGAGLMVKVSVALPVPPALVALIVTLNVPAVVGVPAITPVVGFGPMPDGRPVGLLLVVRLLAVVICEEAAPTGPVAVRGRCVTGGGGGLIVKVKVALPVPPELVALMVTVYGLPASVPTAG